ncbi:MAG: hypothetical protein M3R15_22140 [Acidobacteriota bacterium]|nr:hypothetical protein [Acidobacteriota bacterium]
MKILLLLMTVPIAAVLCVAQEARVVVNTEPKNKEDVRSYYDNSEDRTSTSVFIPLSIEVLGETSKLEINAHFSYQGRQLIAPKDVQFVLSVPCVFGSQLRPDPIVCVDGECSSYHPRGEAGCAGGLTRERASRMFDLPYEMFVKIANGQKVKIQLQSSEVESTSEQIKVLQRLAKRMLTKEADQTP